MEEAIQSRGKCYEDAGAEVDQMNERDANAIRDRISVFQAGRSIFFTILPSCRPIVAGTRGNRSLPREVNNAEYLIGHRGCYFIEDPEIQYEASSL
jgi:hypothetical protein